MDKTTEEKIYEAARTVFIRKGMEGTRMQEIADEAEINKALLHYYFRNKENLFNAVFKNTMSKFFAKTEEVMNGQLSIKEKITYFVHHYIDIIQANPYVPQFIINEINRDPQVLRSLMKDSGLEPEKILKMIANEIGNDDDDQTDPRHIVVSLLGMLIFPFVARPLLQIIYFNDNKEEFDQFIIERKQIVTNMVLKLIEA